VRPTRYIVGLLAIALAVLCTSCLYSRLLSFKNQLGSFDEYVRLTNGGHTLEFLQPIVEPADLTDLTGLPPTHIESQATGEQIHTYNYRSLSPTGLTGTPYKLCFTLHFNSDGLSAFDYPPVMAQILGTNFIVAAAKAIGKSRLNQHEYKLDWACQSTNLAAMPIPSSADMTQVLGMARSCSNTPSCDVADYAFVLERDDGTMRTNETMGAVFQFDPSNSLLRHTAMHIGKLRLVIDLPRVP